MSAGRYTMEDAGSDVIYKHFSEDNIAFAFNHRHDDHESFAGYRVYIAEEVKRLRAVRRQISDFFGGQTFVLRYDGLWLCYAEDA